MARILLTFFVLLLAINNLSPVESSCSKATVYVHQKYKYCKQQSDSCNWNCSSIECAINCSERSRFTSVKVRILTADIVLKETLTIRRNNLAIIGEQKTRLTCANNNIGIAFNGSNNITLSQLEITKCGQKHPYPNHPTHVFYAALAFVNCNYITINNASVTYSSGIGMAMLNTTGHINVTNSNFTDNTKRLEGGGGGAHVTVEKRYNWTKIEFSNCRFINNSKLLSRKNRYAGLESGGGLQIRISYKAKDVHVRLIHCHIVGNKADFGGGLYVGILKSASKNHVTVKDCYIGKNIANQTDGGGGGFDVVFGVEGSYSGFNKNSVSFSNVIIDSNHAILGGGTTIYFADDVKKDNYLKFDNCTWSNNKANYSSAVSVSQNYFKFGRKESAMLPVFKDCTFKNNELFEVYSNYEILRVKLFKVASLATFTVSSSLAVEFQGNTQFTNNKGTALEIYYAKAEFSKKSKACFVNNTATNGAAVYISGISTLKANENSQIHFINNSATGIGGAVAVQGVSYFDVYSNTKIVFKNNSAEFGGAIHYQFYEKEFLSFKYCFLYSRYHNSSFVFTDNKAFSNFGSSIYASTLYPCQKQCHYKCYKIESKNIYKMLNCCLGNVHMDHEDNVTIVTSSDRYYNTNWSNEVFAIPGELIKLEIAVHDELYVNVSNVTLYSVAIESPKNDPNFQIVSRFKHITFSGRIRVYGSPNTTGVIAVTTDDLKNLVIKYTIHLIDCPPGYISNNGTEERKCICIESEYNYLYCEKHGITSSIRIGHWVGYVGQHNNIIATSICPLGFCKQHKITSKYAIKNSQLRVIPSNTTELSSFICLSGRTGTLCGECCHGYSVAYHSAFYECQKDSINCRYGIGLYILAELLPMTCLFLVVLLCNINFTSGAINGFILFAQIIDIMYIDGNNLDSQNYLLNIHVFVYGFLNLNFETTSSSLSFCLWKGATTLNILAMKYVTIIYSVVLVLCLVKFLNHCTCHKICRFCRKQSFGNSIIYGLSAFLVMCYSQCTRVTLTILHPAILWTRGPKEFKRVAFVNGKMNFFGREHNVYAIPAIFFFLTLVAMPPLILLFNSIMTAILQFFCKTGWQVSTYWTNRLLMIKFKPLIDSFQGCYRDEYRCFASFYFLYKVIFLSLYFFLPNKILFYTATLFLLIAILTLHSIIRPYKETWHNVIDILILMNTAIVNGLSFYLYANDNIATVITRGIHIEQLIQLVLIYLPMCCVVLYIIYGFVKKFCKIEFKPNTDKETSYPARLLNSNSVLENYMSCSDQ